MKRRHQTRILQYAQKSGGFLKKCVHWKNCLLGYSMHTKPEECNRETIRSRTLTRYQISSACDAEVHSRKRCNLLSRRTCALYLPSSTSTSDSAFKYFPERLQQPLEEGHELFLFPTQRFVFHVGGERMAVIAKSKECKCFWSIEAIVS